MRDAEFNEPYLVEVYDAECFSTRDDDYFAALVDETPRARVRALVPRGRFAFHAYDPVARSWERWNARDSRRQVVMRDGMMVSIWTEVTSLGDEMVSFSHHYRLPNGETLRSDSTLRFWSEQRIRQSVIDVGFAIERVHYGWSGEAVRPGDGELIFVVRRSSCAKPNSRSPLRRLRSGRGIRHDMERQARTRTQE